MTIATTMTYDAAFHVPVRAAANASKGIRYVVNRRGDPRKLIAERPDGDRREYPVIEVFDPFFDPVPGPYPGPGVYRFVVLRADLAGAERWAAAADPMDCPTEKKIELSSLTP
jgi:hypothetical protein